MEKCAKKLIFCSVSIIYSFSLKKKEKVDLSYLESQFYARADFNVRSFSTFSRNILLIVSRKGFYVENPKTDGTTILQFIKSHS